MMAENILVPRAHDPFGLRQGSAVSIPGADQKDRGLWGREWAEKSVLCHQAGPIFLSDGSEVIGKEDVTLKEK